MQESDDIESILSNLLHELAARYRLIYRSVSFNPICIILNTVECFHFNVHYLMISELTSFIYLMT